SLFTVLRRSALPPSGLFPYTPLFRSRLPVGRVLLKRTDRMFEVAATGNPLAIALRNAILPRVLPIVMRYPRLRKRVFRFISIGRDRKSTRLNSSHDQISYAVFCLKKK